MNLELILWIVAVMISSEILYIFWGIYAKKHPEKDYHGKIIGDGKYDWVSRKLFSLIGGGLFILSQYFIVFIGCLVNECNFTARNYIYLLYEFLIIVGIGLFFWVNYLINKKIMGKKK